MNKIPGCPSRRQNKGLDDIVLIHLDSFKINPKPNTDNKGHLFVTVFDYTAFL